MGDLRRENVIFASMEDSQREKALFLFKWGIFEGKMCDFLVKWGILEEKMHDFRLHVRFL